jgi:hypothetical protein
MVQHAPQRLVLLERQSAYKLASVADLAGVTAEAARILEQGGIAVPAGDCPRTRAL